MPFPLCNTSLWQFPQATDCSYLNHNVYTVRAYVRQMQVDPNGPGTAFPKFARGIEDAMFPIDARRKIRNVLIEHGDDVMAISSHNTEMFYKLKNSRAN